jgi:hypothetical protein
MPAGCYASRAKSHRQVGAEPMDRVVHAARAEPDEPLHLVALARRVEIEMQPAPLARARRGHPVERDVRAAPARVAQDHEAALRVGMSDLVTERRAPEREHPLPLVTQDHDRADRDAALALVAGRRRRRHGILRAGR